MVPFLYKGRDKEKKNLDIDTEQSVVVKEIGCHQPGSRIVDLLLMPHYSGTG